MENPKPQTTHNLCDVPLFWNGTRWTNYKDPKLEVTMVSDGPKTTVTCSRCGTKGGHRGDCPDSTMGRILAVPGVDRVGGFQARVLRIRWSCLDGHEHETEEQAAECIGEHFASATRECARG